MRPIPYHPITATPYERSASYTELAPCDALKPYIRCFWGTTGPVRAGDAAVSKPSLVIPDTCMDIIIAIDYHQHTVTGCFCALDERAYLSRVDAAIPSLRSTFAIRFYAWAASLFTEHPFNGSKNQIYYVADFFPQLEKKLTPMLLSVAALRERAEIASLYLLDLLREDRACHTLMNGVHDMIASRGAMKIGDLAASQAISAKRLERVFDEHMGVSPKAFSSLVRYQLLWQELCSAQRHDILDLVEKYGYFDQSHLLNDFKRHHTMTPTQAIRFARA